MEAIVPAQVAANANPTSIVSTSAFQLPAIVDSGVIIFSTKLPYNMPAFVPQAAAKNARRRLVSAVSTTAEIASAAATNISSQTTASGLASPQLRHASPIIKANAIKTARILSKFSGDTIEFLYTSPLTERRYKRYYRRAPVLP